MKNFILSLAITFASISLSAQFVESPTDILTTTDRVGINTTALDNSENLSYKLTVDGNINVGGTGTARVKTRHVDGKSYNSTDKDDLFLNWNTGKDVIVGKMGTTAALQSDLFISGKVGIGTSNPKTQLFLQTNNQYGLSFQAAQNGWSTIGSNWGGGSKSTAGEASILQFTDKGEIWFRTNKNTTTAANGGWDSPLKMYPGGYVLVGAGDDDLLKDSNNSPITSYKLFVKDGILTEKVKVALSTTGDWADYVFEEDYDLNSIEEVEDFVKENKHLPNIPSAQEMVNKGLNVAEMDAKLLRQIEELWLHTIDVNKKNAELEAKYEAVLERLQELEK